LTDFFWSVSVSITQSRLIDIVISINLRLRRVARKGSASGLDKDRVGNMREEE